MSNLLSVHYHCIILAAPSTYQLENYGQIHELFLRLYEVKYLIEFGPRIYFHIEKLHVSIREVTNLQKSEISQEKYL